MKHLLLFFTLALFSLSSQSFAFKHTIQSHFVTETTNTTVYICNGPYSKKYHFTSECRGLSNCSTDIEKTTLDEAKKKGRTICGWED